MEKKHCPSCARLCSREDFEPDETRKDKLAYFCRGCAPDYERRRRVLTLSLQREACLEKSK